MVDDDNLSTLESFVIRQRHPVNNSFSAIDEPKSRNEKESQFDTWNNKAIILQFEFNWIFTNDLTFPLSRNSLSCVIRFPFAEAKNIGNWFAVRFTEHWNNFRKLKEFHKVTFVMLSRGVSWRKLFVGDKKVDKIFSAPCIDLFVFTSYIPLCVFSFSQDSYGH